MVVQIKICGLKTPDAVTAALEEGADFIGLVFYPPSPRHVDLEVATYIAGYIPAKTKIVGLFVDPDDQTLQTTLESVRLDMIQLHGSEPPERVAAIRVKFRLPVMKAIPLKSAKDLKAMGAYESVADWLLFDAKGEKLPGGNGIAFDWSILKGRTFQKPWMLAGGLTADNLEEALSILSPDAVDVSSGVESAPGVKDPEKIRAFIKLALSAKSQ
jgi:phosphoribosylanthranilate isomerase